MVPMLQGSRRMRTPVVNSRPGFLAYWVGMACLLGGPGCGSQTGMFGTGGSGHAGESGAAGAGGNGGGGGNGGRMGGGGHDDGGVGRGGGGGGDVGGVGGGGGRGGDGRGETGTSGAGGVGGGGGRGGDVGGGSGGSGAGGVGGIISCGDKACTDGQICIDNTTIPNMGTAIHSNACSSNPCGSGPLSCDCAGALCVGIGAAFCSTPSARILTCRFESVCASPETRIATPQGQRRIADLLPGDLVYSEDRHAIRAVPLLRVGQTPVYNHHVMQVTMVDGTVLEMSAGHPTADGRTFGQLRPGDRLDGGLVVSSQLIPYRFARTYDILPASDTGTYVASGHLVGSTLR